MQPTTALTCVCVAVWLFSLAVRLHDPDWAPATGIDGMMVTIVGYWFFTAGRRRGRGSM